MAAADLVSWAWAVAEQHLEPLGRRWDHVQAVGRLAESIAPAFGSDAESLIASAYLHDIGYAPPLAGTGFHPLDGGRFVRDQGYEQLARLVAHHSGARIEAELRGIAGYCSEFPHGESALDDALTFCDLTTSPNGSRVTLADRVAEINERYGPDAVTARAITAGAPDFERACTETIRRVEAAGSGWVSGSRVGPA
jgi:hypothetical protein